MFVNPVRMMGAVLLAGLWILAQSLVAAPKPSKKSEGLAGTFGFAADSVGGGGGTLSGFSAPNAVGFRYWILDELGADAALAVNNSSAATATNTFGLGLGVVYNLRQPVPGLYIQTLGRLSFSADSTNVGGSSVNTNTLSLFGGVGFEAFIPAWPKLSVSGGTGLQFSTTSGGGSSTTAVNTTNYGSTPVQVGIHFYF
jgi:hypothetical protein